MAQGIFELRVAGARPIEALLGRAIAVLGDLTPLMDHLGQVIETQTDERFESETAPDGSSWAPSHRAREQGGKTLTDSGLGRRSVSHRASATRVEVGTNLPYMAAHQTGAVIEPKSAKALAFKLPGGALVFTQRVELPKREWLGLSADNADELVEEAEDWLAAACPGLLS